MFASERVSEIFGRGTAHSHVNGHGYPMCAESKHYTPYSDDNIQSVMQMCIDLAAILAHLFVVILKNKSCNRKASDSDLLDFDLSMNAWVTRCPTLMQRSLSFYILIRCVDRQLANILYYWQNVYDIHSMRIAFFTHACTLLFVCLVMFSAMCTKVSA